jgi:medium-chain acyl-[acyl-carrier-protein] hydrolase
LPSEIEVCPVELPGRVSRANEAPLDRIEPLVDALLRALARYFAGPFAFFGYSMGALVAFELARRLVRARLREPLHLFVAARGAPQLMVREQIDWSSLTDRELLAELQRRYRPLPQDVVDDRDLMSLILPMLRADLQLAARYRCAPQPPLRCALTAFGGACDAGVSAAELAAWGENTSGAFGVQQFDGGHFFLETQRDALLHAIRCRLPTGHQPFRSSAPPEFEPRNPTRSSAWKLNEK